MLQQQLANQVEFRENPLHDGQQRGRLADGVEAGHLDERFGQPVNVLEELGELGSRL
jgi:hypothetical protein